MRDSNELNIAAVVGVKDQVDLLPACVKNLLEIGVDTVTIVDDDSVDGTKELILDLARAQPSRIFIPEPCNSLGSYLSFSGPILGAIVSKFHPDWLLACDADEFYVPRTGDLRTIAGLHSLDVISVPRFNLAFQGPESFRKLGLDYQALLDMPLVMATNSFSASNLEEHDSEDRWILRRIVPKLMVRPRSVSKFTPGMHNVEAVSGQKLNRGAANDLLAVHLPFTDYEQFRRKVDNVKAVFERYDADYNLAGWHWRRWVKLADEGNLRAEFDRQIIAPQELDELKRSGMIRSAREILHADVSHS